MSQSSKKEEQKKEFFEELNKKIKITGNTQTENRNWINYFLMLKRWYYRLRDSDLFCENSYSIGSLKMEDDYLWVSLILCHHLKDWLIFDKVADWKETKDYISKNKSLSLCADICNVNKHVKLDKYEHSWTKDLETKIINTSFEVEYKNKKNFVPAPFALSNGNTINAYNLMEECMQAWGKFIVSKNLPIPEFEEENTISGFVKWELKE